MFQNWGFLITEMVGLIIIAALFGLLAGWLIWGRRSEVNIESNATGEADGLRRDLEACRAKHADKDARIATLEADLAEARNAAKASDTPAAAPVAAAAASMAAATPAASEPAAADNDGAVDYDGDGIIEGKDEGTKPKTLDAARGGQPDDLKQIKGIGPKLEKLCNRLGFYHFDQIANWSSDEVAWVDANLEGFKGRVSRDQWVAQAKTLAEGGTTEFSERVKGGDVYE